MKRSIFILMSIFYYVECSTLNFAHGGSFTGRQQFYNDEDVGEPLYLTEYIKNGNIKEGKRKALVQHPDLKNIRSYAGFLTINETYDSNTFFWFFPSQTKPKEDPVILWMVGGPGVSILVSVFGYNGPISVNTDEMVQFRKDSYNTNHSIIYIDSPIGSGYSHTKNELGYNTNANETARDVLLALVQFFKLFPEYKQNQFYVGGDSYAGKYVVTVADAIREYNGEQINGINLHGLIIGSGVIDPHNQTVLADFLYTIGLFDVHGMNQYKPLESNPSGKGPLMTELFQNLTGYTDKQNFLRIHYPYELLNYYNWSQKASVRKAMHVGKISYFWQNSEVMRRTKDLGKSVTSTIEKLLDTYKVLFYNGQLDEMMPYTSSIKLYRSFKWSGAQELKKAKRTQLWLKDELIGYGKFIKNVTEILVRNSGHAVALEQLAWCSNLITRFTHDQW